MFADDTNIFVVGENKGTAFENANIVLNKINTYMFQNLLYINFDKSVYMHFRPNLNISQRLTCARSRPNGSEPVLKINGHKLKKVNKAKLIRVIIDDKLNWEAHIEHLKAKLNLSTIMIKRIKKFIPKPEFKKICDALFTSHMNYCISSWGGVSDYKLQSIFTIQKRCVHLLFGEKYSYDHAGYYETFAGTRTYKEHTSPKNYSLEHTKPIFNKYEILNFHNLFVHHSFMDLYKVFKTHTPISIFEIFQQSNRDTNFLVKVPEVPLNTSKCNFAYKSSVLWNTLIGKVLDKSEVNDNGIIITGSSEKSDFCASVPFVKNTLKTYLLTIQKYGNDNLLEPSNFL